ncbi:Putative membrane-associated motif in lps-induced tumor necrosis factor alpha factor [Gryllus bimaculatus]|nr:Putative membrane-associated motif in lps-induced tumor necrosis factor alpha factor [Gryllus bimaculatus]
MPAVYWSNSSVGVVPTVHMAGPPNAFQSPGYAYGQGSAYNLGPVQPAFAPFSPAPAAGKGLVLFSVHIYGTMLFNVLIQVFIINKNKINVTEVVVGGPPLGPSPANITCPSCHAQIQTRVSHESSTKTHIIALLLCLFGSIYSRYCAGRVCACRTVWTAVRMPITTAQPVEPSWELSRISTEWCSLCTSKYLQSCTALFHCTDV